MEITKLNKDEIISVGRKALAKSETTSLTCLIILHSRFYAGVAKDIRKGKIDLLKRGECYTIEGKTFFTFGGAYSIDRLLRKEGVSWWWQELPSPEEFNALLKLSKNIAALITSLRTPALKESCI